MSNIIWLNIL